MQRASAILLLTQPLHQFCNDQDWPQVEHAWLQLSLVKAQDIDSYIEEQGPGAVLSVDAVRQFEVMKTKEVSDCSNMPTTLSSLRPYLDLTALAGS